MSRTVSSRIPTALHEELRERCNLIGESINDFVKACIEMGLHNSCDFDFGDEEEEEPEKITISEIPKKEQKPKVFTHGKILDDNGNVIGTF